MRGPRPNWIDEDDYFEQDRGIFAEDQEQSPLDSLRNELIQRLRLRVNSLMTTGDGVTSVDMISLEVRCQMAEAACRSDVIGAVDLCTWLVDALREQEKERGS